MVEPPGKRKQMRDKKLCPFLNHGVPCVDQDLVSGMWQCVEDKCQMWRETPVLVFDHIQKTWDKTGRSEFYCGLAGKPQ